MPQSLASLHCHVVFSTKNREPFIRPEIKQPLYDYIGRVLCNTRCVLCAAGGVADHVHLLVSLHREVAVAEAVRAVKCNSSRWVHESFPDLLHFAWQTGYGAFNVSYSLLDSVRKYLARQEEHHKNQSFKDEMLLLLKKHHIEYDEKYLWD
jgi:putative transposase